MRSFTGLLSGEIFLTFWVNPNLTRPWKKSKKKKKDKEKGIECVSYNSNKSSFIELLGDRNNITYNQRTYLSGPFLYIQDITTFKNFL